MNQDRFGSLADLMTHHSDLVTKVGRDLLTEENLRRISDFIRRAIATGAVLGVREDRVAAQELIGFWTSRVATAVREEARAARRSNGTMSATATPPDFGCTLLTEFDPETLADAISEADRFVAELTDETDRTLVRRIMMRLLRLRSEPTHVGAPLTDGDLPTNTPASVESPFDPIPASRAALYDLGPEADVNRVNELVAALAAAGVLRVVPGETLSADLISLRAPALVTKWSALKEWAAGREAMRQRAAEHVAGRPKKAGKTANRLARAGEWSIRILAAVSQRFGQLASRALDWYGTRQGYGEGLLRRDEMAEVQAYHDRNADERRLLTDSRAWEQKTGDANRTLLGIVAIALANTGFSAVGTAVSARQAWIESEASSKAAIDAKKAEGIASSAAQDAHDQRQAAILSADEATAKRELEEARLRLSSLRLVIRAWSELITAPTPADQAIARARWDSLTKQETLRRSLNIDLPQLLEAATVRNNEQKMSRDKAPSRNDPDSKSLRDDVLKVRNELLKYPEIQQTLRETRQVAFDLVRLSVTEATKIYISPLTPKYSSDSAASFVREFWAQYWGEMLLVERRIVANAMVGYGETLKEIQNRPASTSPGKLLDLQKELGKKRDDLIKALSLEERGPLPGQPASPPILTTNASTPEGGP